MRYLKLRKTDIIDTLKPMYEDYFNNPDDRKYNDLFDLMEDFIIWSLDGKRSVDVYQAWLKFQMDNRNKEWYSCHPLVIDTFLGEQSRWWFTIEAPDVNFIL